LRKKTEKKEHIDRTVYQDKTMETVMHDSMIPYSEHVILDRAIPRVEDGLKPVQRRVLYVMYEQGLTPDKPFRKSANIVGETMAKYHPHGDSSIYETMVRLAQDFNMRVPLVEGNGNFGSMDGDPAAAFRYTEARLASPALSMMTYLPKETVTWSLNFDDTRKEPDILPTLFPNLLINGASGIAVGLATSIPPHHPAEVIDGVIAYLSHPRITLEEMMQIIPAPDFPTGGIIVNGEAMKQIYATGAGKITVRAKAHIETSTDGKPQIVITEFPFQTNKADLLAKILEHAQGKKEIIAQITDIRDESDRTGIRSVIELKKGCDAARMLAYLYKYTDLQKNIGVNMVAIAEGKPRQLGLLDAIRYYTEFRCRVERSRIEYDLKQLRAREEILVGLSVAAQNIDQVIAIIRSSRTAAIAKEALCQTFRLTENQAHAILEMKLRRITALEVESVEKELAEVRAQIAELEPILESKAKLNTVVKHSLQQIRRQFTDPRLTEVKYDHVEEDISRDAFKTVETAVVYVDDNSCLHRITEKAFENLSKATPIPKERYVITKTDRVLLVFGAKGMCYQMKVDVIPEGKSKDKGSIPEKLIMNFDDRRILCIAEAKGDDAKDKVLFATAKGMLKCSELGEYCIRRNKFDALKLKDGDYLIYVGIRRPAHHMAYETDSGKKKTYRESIEPTGRKTCGIRAVKAPGNPLFVKAYQEEN